MIQNRHKDWEKKTDLVLENAWNEGRNQLFEHEVYEILKYLGISTPIHSFLTRAEDINRFSLNSFGSSKVVLKVVSDSVIHKKKLGGVRIVHKDLEFVKYSFTKMIDEFKSLDLPARGILVTEFVDYSEEIGNEILIGFRETPSFGPVLSFTKGGADAEHFASRYSPPNLVLPPVTIKWARDLLSSTEIYKKYTSDKRDIHIDLINKAQVRFSDLSMAFSGFFPGKSRFKLKEFEINPFIFDRDGSFLAIDGYASFGLKKEKLSVSAAPSHHPPVSTMTPFFYPDGIAVLGVSSSNPLKSGNIIVKNLLKAGREDVFCVNPRGGFIEAENRNLKMYGSINEITENIDFAVITVPAAAVLDSVKECADKKVKAVLLIPGGFSETTENRDIEDEILSIARKNNFRIMGPNCLGIYHSEGKINTFFIPENKFTVQKHRRQNVAILSQSGALGIVEIFNLRNALAPRAIISYGNELDSGPCDLVPYFADDSEIKVIALYVEGFKEGDGRRFFDLVSKIHKPIVVYKAGRTQEGQKATQSHTASMSGEYAVAKAAMIQAGIIVADSMADHTGYIKTFSLFSGLTVHDRKIAVIANAGYEKANAADNIGDLEITKLDEETLSKLKEIIPDFVKPEPLLDLTPMADDKAYIDAVKTLLESSSVDALLVSIIPQAGPLHTTNEEILSYEKNVASELVKIVKKFKKPVIASTGIESSSGGNFSMLNEILDAGGIPSFSSAEKAMKYLNAFIRYKLIKEKNIMSEWLRQE
ncbi:MAG: acetate--CoA ligase family protein [Spirochaetia bacterium]|jgi:acyl-CoA synthetase (NDP forming)|nr:acetate--CoA ligase family protein [Spirochaetia bacterium]